MDLLGSKDFNMDFNSSDLIIVQTALSKFGLPYAYWVKVIYIHFLEETFMLFKKKDVSIFFSCRINIIVTSRSNVPFFVI